MPALRWAHIVEVLLRAIAFGSHWGQFSTLICYHLVWFAPRLLHHVLARFIYVILELQSQAACECKIFFSPENTSRKIHVATGMVIPGDVCHHVRLPPGWLKVQVDSIVSTYEKTPLPQPTQEATLLIHAKRIVVPWRADWVEIVKTVFLFIQFSNCIRLIRVLWCF